MNPAAVGFQCPGCLAQGAKATRSGRGPYGGRRSADPSLTSKVLIATNLAVFLLIQVTGGGGSAWFYRLALIPQGASALVDGFPQFVPGVADGSWWQLATSAFTHIGIFHIGFNMLALWVLGPQLEMVLGRVRFLAVYALSALGGSTAVYWLTATNVPTIGASGAVYGLMGALLVVAWKVHGNVSQLLLWIGLNFVITLAAPFISWQGHLGGFLGGMAVAAVMVFSPRAGRPGWQLAGGLGIAFVLLAALVARTLVLA